MSIIVGRIVKQPVYKIPQRLLPVAIATIGLLPRTACADHPGLDFGGATAGPIQTISTATLSKDAKVFGLQSDYLKSEEFSNNKLKAFAAQGVEAHSLRALLTTSLVLAYGFTEDFTLGIRLPHVRRTNLREGESAVEVHEHGDSKGVGDMTILGKYRVAKGLNDREATLLLGLKTPTGNTHKTDRDGNRFETEHQAGSGSWDPILGVAISERLERASLHASILYTFATNGAQKTNLGDRAQYGVAVSWRAGNETPSRPHDTDEPHPHEHGTDETFSNGGYAWDWMLELNGTWENRQEITGIKDRNSGGHRVFLSPGARYVSSDGWAAYLSVGVPVVQNMNGAQTDAKLRLTAGVASSF